MNTYYEVGKLLVDAGKHYGEGIIKQYSVKLTNELGRRMKFSIVGNQRMADQNLGDNASNDAFSKVDSVTPSEIDADSAQKIVLMPPTGQNKNYIPVIVSLIAAAGLIVAAVVIIKKNILKNNAQ